MRRTILGLLFSLWASVASAGVTCTLPFNLVNNTTADATQVMANYNALVACLTRAAASGVNTDITSIIGLTTPLPPSQGGTNVFVTGAGVSTGSANAQVITPVTPGSFSLSPGNVVMFIAGFTNSGVTTWNVNGTGAVNVVLHTASGISSLSGGEIVAGQVTLGYYDGTQYQLLDAAPPTGFVQPCTVIDYAGVAAPSGYLSTNGGAVLRASFPNLFACLSASVAATTNSTTTVTVPNSALFQIGWFVGGNNIFCNSVISSIPNGSSIILNNSAGATGATTLTIGPQPQGDCATTFNVPNYNGRALAMIDLTGTVLTNPTCTNATSVGSLCGNQTTTLLTNNLPPYTPTGAISTSPGTAAPSVSAGGTIGTSSNTASGSLGAAFTGNAQGGTSAAFSNVSPIALTYKAIKF